MYNYINVIVSQHKKYIYHFTLTQVHVPCSTFTLTQSINKFHYMAFTLTHNLSPKLMHKINYNLKPQLNI